MSKDTVSLEVQSREVTGKAVKHLRKEGQVPIVIHDHGKESILAQVEYMALAKIWKSAGKHHAVEIKGLDKPYTGLIKDVDLDPRMNTIKHVVFNAVSATQMVEAEVPVHPKYAEGNESSPAERSGFIVLAQADVVIVESIASKLPNALYYDAEKLVEVGDFASVADLFIPDGVKVKTDISQSLATVYEPSALQAANDSAGGDAEEASPEAGVEEEVVVEGAEKPA